LFFDSVVIVKTTTPTDCEYVLYKLTDYVLIINSAENSQHSLQFSGSRG